MGEVWRAHHHTTRRPVALKVIHQRDSTFRDRFSREAQAMRLLTHPHIVPIHDYFIIKGYGYLVMGLIDGRSLADLGRMSCGVALQIAGEILDALNFAHQEGVIHRDVKPSNILIDTRGLAYMTDFGIALVAGTERITRLTHTGTAVGTPEYMSPEQIITPQDIDHRTDVYSFGCVLYEMLAGEPPFGSRDVGTTEFELMQAHVKRAPAPIRQRNVEVDRNTERVITRALAKDREQRFGGCGEMAQALLHSALAPAASAGAMSFAHLLFSLRGRWRRSQS
jgi:serine/threonine-protein kinase